MTEPSLVFRELSRNIRLGVVNFSDGGQREVVAMGASNLTLVLVELLLACVDLFMVGKLQRLLVVMPAQFRLAAWLSAFNPEGGFELLNNALAEAVLVHVMVALKCPQIFHLNWFVADVAILVFLWVHFADLLCWLHGLRLRLLSLWHHRGSFKVLQGGVFLNRRAVL